jgi:hypothetical protein
MLYQGYERPPKVALEVGSLCRSGCRVVADWSTCNLKLTFVGSSRRLDQTVMASLSSACRSATRTLRVPLASSLSTGLRFTSSRVGASTSSSSDVGPAGQSVKDLVAEEAKDLVTAEVVSGAPGMLMIRWVCTGFAAGELTHSLSRESAVELQHRAVRIYQPTRNTMQSGGAKGENWRIDFDVLQGGGRWENPLMGWASSCVIASHDMRTENR